MFIVMTMNTGSISQHYWWQYFLHIGGKECEIIFTNVIDNGPSNNLKSCIDTMQTLQKKGGGEQNVLEFYHEHDKII